MNADVDDDACVAVEIVNAFALPTETTLYVPDTVTPPTVVDIGKLIVESTLNPWFARVTVTAALPETVVNFGTAAGDAVPPDEYAVYPLVSMPMVSVLAPVDVIVHN